MRRTVHRADTGREFRGIPMHAAGGVHEYAVHQVESRIPPGAFVLDVGTGSGALAARLEDRGYRVLACDLNGSGYRGGAPFVEWDVASASAPPSIEQGSLDGICAIEILEHVENPSQALRNLFALLKPGGSIVVSTPNLTHPRSRVKFLLRGAPAYFGRAEFFDSGHRTLLPDWMLELMLQEAGFEGVAISYAGSMGLRRGSRLAYALVSAFFKFMQIPLSPRTDDGCITFAIARKP